MIDLHCHILPNIDDGPRSLDESLEMARYAIKQGITHITCTPHHNDGRFYNPSKKVIECTKTFKYELRLKDLQLTVSSGQEIRITPAILRNLNSREFTFEKGDQKYVLLELPANELPQYALKICSNFIRRGYIPIIAHPERNSVFINNPNKLIPFLEIGTLAQVTAPSVVGFFGSEVQEIAVKMIQHNFVQTIASDAHGLKNRTFYLKEAYDFIDKKIDTEKAKIMKSVAFDLLNGNELSKFSFYPIKMQHFWSFFKM